MRILHPDQYSRALSAGAGRRIQIRGTVQGVGFRPWVYRVAHESAVTGRVRNDSSGVTIEAFGPASALDQFVDRLEHGVHRPAAAVIDRLDAQTIPFEQATEFEIVESADTDAPRISIPADLATCPACLREIRNPANRRYRYPFTNCTNCGPRFTIASAAPYDRPNTTMGAFRMCPDCQREYDTVADRRFHAQPNACPTCGPRLELCRADGQAIETDDVIGLAAKAIAEDSIVALKGIGGFQLACDATSETAVLRLRARKRRDEKPFAVMVGTIDQARALAVLSPDEEALLTSTERPIVLVPRREGAALAPSVAPRNPLVGLLLAYSPLHHLLLDKVARPLVMTSGNLSEEPIAYRNDEGLTRLRTVADVFVLHDREIITRCDDSVARVIAQRPVVLRRARGYVPSAVCVSTRFTAPVLACGALLKNTFCLGRDDEAVMGPHIGDLENVEVYRAYVDSIGRLERFLRIRPEIVAHDLHPDYLSTRYAKERGGANAIGVQHHHAHVASVMAEHGLEGPVLGVAYDGTGYGLDGTAWGAELLLTTFAEFTRIATFRPLPLPGGDSAIRQPWRIALAMMEDAFEADAPLDAFALFRGVAAADIETIRRMIHQHVNTPLAHGLGRYFDGFGALLLERARASFEGQVALELNMAADPQERGRYRYEITRAACPWQVDLRPAVRDAVFESLGGELVSRIAARFHNTLAAATADLVRSAARQFGRLPVALSGGCFQNARLAETIVGDLSPDFRVWLHERVPPGDGGIALGQAAVASERARRS